jgi:hypothetical protein
MTGMGIAIVAWMQLAGLKKEFKASKKQLVDSGVLEEQPEAEDQ